MINTNPAVESGYTSSYLGDQHAGQLARLRTLECAFDPLSQTVFEQLNLPEKSAILDVGAGAGSLAGWPGDSPTRRLPPPT